MANREYIHRMGMTARPRCGAEGPVRLSTSGVLITCPDCIEISRPRTREEQLAALRESVERARIH
ncbi:MAG: hypothetical protein KGL39_43395 [Patescibacteria group bacterium]|nr:hypothetical protein [Patescibacteria group bacterium]